MARSNTSKRSTSRFLDEPSLPASTLISAERCNAVLAICAGGRNLLSWHHQETGTVPDASCVACLEAVWRCHQISGFSEVALLVGPRGPLPTFSKSMRSDLRHLAWTAWHAQDEERAVANRTFIRTAAAVLLGLCPNSPRKRPTAALLKSHGQRAFLYLASTRSLVMLPGCQMLIEQRGRCLWPEEDRVSGQVAICDDPGFSTQVRVQCAGNVDRSILLLTVFQHCDQRAAYGKA